MPYILPDPRGKKSFPTMLSNTDDFPELCETIKKHKNTILAQAMDRKLIFILQR